MTAKGHVVLSSVITLSAMNIFSKYMGYIGVTSFNMYVMFYVFTVIGSLLPDIDEPHSYIGNKLKLLSIIVSVVGHRTFTHYLLVPILLIVSAIFVADNQYSKIILFGLGFGILNHDIGDLLTKGGIKGFLYPLLPNTKIVLLPSFLRFQTFSTTEYIFIAFILIPLNIMSIYILINNIGVVI